MDADAALLDAVPGSTADVAPGGDADRWPDRSVPSRAPRRGSAPRTAARSSGSSPCARFAWAAAGSGGALFLAGLVEAAGTWSLSAGAVSLTVASIAGVIAMEGCEERTGRAASPAPGRPWPGSG